MFGFFKKDKYEQQAKAAIERRAMKTAPKTAAKAGLSVSPTSKSTAAVSNERQAAIARMQAQVAPMVTPERQALLQKAMSVHRAKQQIFNDLDDESRAKLVAMAITTLLRQGQLDDPKSRKK